MDYQGNRDQQKPKPKFQVAILAIVTMLLSMVSIQATFAQSSGEKIYTVVDQQPEFQGGYSAMMDFIRKNMRYPDNAQRRGIDGTVYLSFVVSTSGSISDVKTIRGISPDCDKEAMRVISMMPPWVPGKQSGQPVYVRVMLPVKFKLN